MNYYRNNNSNASGWVSVIILVIVICFTGMSSCSQQNITKNWGGEMDIELEPNQKLVNITWKESDLWILTKDMTENDVEENYQFAESSTLGIFEGTIYIHENKMTKEELAAYELSKVLEKDYYVNGNFEYYEDGTTKEVFIHYDEITDSYSLIKDYEYDSETGMLKEKR